MKNKFIAFSGGVESTTMCLLYGGEATAIFSDTGWEHQVMYDRLLMVEEKIKAIHPNFTIVRVQNEKHGRLQDYIREKKYFPGIRSRFCTRMFKIEPIDNFLKSQGDCQLMIGLNADEGDRVGNLEKMENVQYDYPLFQNGITRQMCIDKLTEVDLLPELPVYMRRGGCVGCFFKSKKEFSAMYHLAPDEFKDVESIEKDIQDKRGQFYSIRKDIPSMEDLRQYEEQSLFPPEELYEALLKADEVSNCGVFCHR